MGISPCRKLFKTEGFEGARRLRRRATFGHFAWYVMRGNKFSDNRLVETRRVSRSARSVICPKLDLGTMPNHLRELIENPFPRII